MIAVAPRIRDLVRRPILSLLVVVLGLPVFLEGAAADGNCAESAQGVGDYIAVVAECTSPGSGTGAQVGGSSEGDTQPIYVAYQWLSVCAGAAFTQQPTMVTDCGAARVCPESDERLWRLWGQLTTGQWVALGSQCLGAPPEAADTPRPRITPAMVLNEIRRIGLPTLQARTQPEGKTLVNFDTIFYTEAQPFSATVTLLGRQVDIIAEPASYTWHHGDGATTTTSTPGAPYPSTDITYRYARADTTVRPRVDVTYTARFRVNGGDWRDIDETVTIAGPEGSLRVAEAHATLSGDYG